MVLFIIVPPDVISVVASLGVAARLTVIL